jgi:RNA 2',3'-cyclic 3'-phosphodiesterase
VTSGQRLDGPEFLIVTGFPVRMGNPDFYYNSRDDEQHGDYEFSTLPKGCHCMSETWRMFAAVDLTDEIRDRIKRTQQLLDEAGWNCRWVAEERMHMTVRFYGELEVPTVEQLQEELRARLAAQPAFELRVSRVGAFPGPNRPRTLWLGIDDRFQQLGKLRKAVDDASSAVGIEPEPGPYRPHLTVGRLIHTFRVDEDEAVEAFQEFGAYEPLFWIPEHVNLVKSKFGRGGIQYTIIEQFSLGEPDGTVSNGDADVYAAPSMPTLLDFLDNSDPPEIDETPVFEIERDDPDENGDHTAEEDGEYSSTESGGGHSA